MSRKKTNVLEVDPLKFRIWLAARDLSYSALANKLGTSPSLIRLWVIGASGISENHLKKTTQLLGCKKTDILRNKGEIPCSYEITIRTVTKRAKK